MAFDKLAHLENIILDRYIQSTQKSREQYATACKSMPGGVSGGIRIFNPYPLYMTHGQGCKTFDIDGNEYIDCFLCSGALLLGHCHPEVMKTVKEELKNGLLLANPRLLVDCAEFLQSLIPCAEKVRFMNSGTEAALSAVRIARAHTGKNKIIKFYGHYIN